MFSTRSAICDFTNRKPSSTMLFLEQYSIDVEDNPQNPGRHIHSHMDFLKENYASIFRYRWGIVFELMFADALIKFRTSDNRSIAIDSLKFNKQAIADKGIWQKLHVDVDLKLNDSVLFFLKTSARERYKLTERDSMMPLMEYYEKYHIHYKERSTDTVPQILQQVDKLQSTFTCNTRLITVYNESETRSLFNSLVNKWG